MNSVIDSKFLDKIYKTMSDYEKFENDFEKRIIFTDWSDMYLQVYDEDVFTGVVVRRKLLNVPNSRAHWFYFPLNPILVKVIKKNLGLTITPRHPRFRILYNDKRMKLSDLCS